MTEQTDYLSGIDHIDVYGPDLITALYGELLRRDDVAEDGYLFVLEGEGSSRMGILHEEDEARESDDPVVTPEWFMDRETMEVASVKESETSENISINLV